MVEIITNWFIQLTSERRVKAEVFPRSIVKFLVTSHNSPQKKTQEEIVAQIEPFLWTVPEIVNMLMRFKLKCRL